MRHLTSISKRESHILPAYNNRGKFCLISARFGWKDYESGNVLGRISGAACVTKI
jgi:hypothetical protein